MTRKAYCTGCGLTFAKHHTLYNHRRSNRCGGIYLSEAERNFVTKLRLERELQLRIEREERHAAKDLNYYGNPPKLDAGSRRANRLGRDLRRRQGALGRRNNDPHVSRS